MMVCAGCYDERVLLADKLLHYCLLYVTCFPLFFFCVRSVRTNNSNNSNKKVSFNFFPFDLLADGKTIHTVFLSENKDRENILQPVNYSVFE